jgi:glucans biosynthesis protein
VLTGGRLGGRWGAPWSRRDLVAAGLGATLLPLVPRALAATAAPPLGDPEPFSFERLIEQARALAGQPYAPPPPAPDWVAQLTPEQQRAIHVLPERVIQLGPTPFQLRPVHLGAFYRDPVRLYLVEAGIARELLYDPAMFDLGGARPPDQPSPQTGFAGLRVFFPLNPGGSYDELLAFLGTSQFRAVGRGTRYGVSARGLALDTGAYRFVVVPRDQTVMQVDASLFFRNDVQQVGIAPVNSMFSFGPGDRAGVDDYRERVHNSGDLSLWRGNGEVLLRPLVNPTELRVSVFGDENPRGFGCLQRHRSLMDYRDLDGRWDLRPNLWVEPKGAWGKGSVRLIEVPTPDETHDNIVAFWTPDEPVRAKSELRLAYALTWTLEAPLQTGLAQVVETSVGRGGKPGEDRPPELRHVAIDFGPAPGQNGSTPAPEVRLECNNGTCPQPLLQPNPGTGGWRVGFDYRLGGNVAELRCLLTQGGRPVSETWLYRLDKT